MIKSNNHHFRIDLNNIIKRLPLLRQINASQSALLSFTPAWKRWSNENLPENFRSLTSLNSFNDGVLSIKCKTPIAASQLRHLQISLIEALHEADHHQILSLNIQIDHETPTPESAVQEHIKQVETTLPNTTRAALSDQAIDNINSCQKSVKSEKLSDALKRLSETLKKEN